MAGLLFVVVIFAMARQSSATWCTCKQGLSNAALQKTLDYACGAGADCNPLHQNGVCYNPNTLLAHCNYAVNSYFQRKGQAAGSCDFAGTATVTTSDPSTAGCAYPSGASTAGTTTTPVTTTPTTSTPTTPTTSAPTTPTTTTPMTPTTTTPTTPTTPTPMTPTTTTPTTPTTTTPTVGGSPYVTTPSTGGFGTGVGPSGAGTYNDQSHGGYLLEKTSTTLLLTFLFSGLVFPWG